MQIFHVACIVRNGQSVVPLDQHEQFHTRADKERFFAVGSRYCQILKVEDFTMLFGGLRPKIASKSMGLLFHAIHIITDL